MPSLTKIRKKRLNILIEFEEEGDFSQEAVLQCITKYNSYIGDIGGYSSAEKVEIFDLLADFNNQLHLILKNKGINYAPKS